MATTLSQRIIRGLPGIVGIAWKKGRQDGRTTLQSCLGRVQPFSTSSTEAKPQVTLDSIIKMYKEKEPIVMMTAYDYVSARACDSAGVDVVLVGDSLSMTFFGRPDTLSLTKEEMLHHLIAVKRGLKRSFMVADMVYGSYEMDIKSAFDSCVHFLKSSGANAIKMEGGSEICPQIEKLTSAGMVVIGHVGLTPQRVNSLSGFKVQGKDADSAKKLLEDAKALETAGCSMIVIEAVPEKLAEAITDSLNVPTIGIGAGKGCSGQVLVYNDALGLNPDRIPRFCKTYENLFEKSVNALNTYVSDVKSGAFPETGVHTFKGTKSMLEAIKEHTKE